MLSEKHSNNKRIGSATIRGTTRPIQLQTTKRKQHTDSPNVKARLVDMEFEKLRLKLQTEKRFKIL
jgi:hypothetical protein